MGVLVGGFSQNRRPPTVLTACLALGSAPAGGEQPELSAQRVSCYSLLTALLLKCSVRSCALVSFSFSLSYFLLFFLLEVLVFHIPFFFFWYNTLWLPIQLILFALLLPFQFSSVAQSCLILRDPMKCSKPGFPVHHQLPEFTQTHVHGVGDTIKPSHPLSSPSPPVLNSSQHQGLF